MMPKSAKRFSDDIMLSIIFAFLESRKCSSLCVDAFS
jgi:hypothetical protein